MKNINTILNRLWQLFQRRQRAKKLGFKFNRVSDFNLPDTIVCLGKQDKISIPSEPGMMGEFIEVILDDCYNIEKLVKKLARTNIKILDIGSNVGLFGIAARQAFPDAIIHSYEPNPNLEKYLKNQAQIANFKYYLEAVGIENGKMNLIFDEKGASARTRSFVDDEGSIQMTAFRQVIERLGGEVDFAKIDCEGAEWLLFQDTQPWQSIKNLAMEYHLRKKDQTLAKVRENLQNLGFKIDAELEYDQYYGLIFASRN